MSRVNDFNMIMNGARVKLPGALDAQIKAEIFMVVDEFMKETEIWTETIDVPVNASDFCYDVVPTLGLPNALHEVKTSTGQGVAAAMEIPGTVGLQRQPAVADTYKVKVALTVAYPLTGDDLPQFPDWILAQYYPVFLDGVLARMMATLGKPYSSEKGALFHGQKFRAGKSQAMVNSQRKNLSGGQTWRFPKFA